MACFSFMCTTTSAKGISKAGFDNVTHQSPSSPLKSHMCIASPSLLPTGVTSAFCRHSPAKRKKPDNQEWHTVGASRRPQTVGNPCDKILIGFQPLFSGSHKRPREEYAGKYSELNCCPMQPSSTPKTGFDQIGECSVRN